MKILKSLLILFLCPICLKSQTITGTIIDAKTNEPLETVNIFFDNTTLGTTTNAKGEFSITYTDKIKTTLVISYLGYEKQYFDNYRELSHLNISLKEDLSLLDEVVINTNDGLTRKQKLRLFRQEFLGKTANGKSCKILNEDALILRYNKPNKTLTAASNEPLIVLNKNLRYKISFDITDFEIGFSYANGKTNEFSVNQVTYFGTTFYKNEEGSKKKKIIKRRQKTYLGSAQHFLRALYSGDLKKEKYQFFYKGFVVPEDKYVRISEIEDSDFKKVEIIGKLGIVYKNNIKSSIQLFDVNHFQLDEYGNYTPIQGVMFSGTISEKRVGDLLPFDYEYSKND